MTRATFAVRSTGFQPVSLNRKHGLRTPATCFIAVIGVVCLAGCGAERLETGYVPRKIGASETVRKGYYAEPFTPQSQAAQKKQEESGTYGTMGSEIRHPRSY